MEIIQLALNKLANSMRIYAENSVRFQQLRRIDTEEAINNLDRAFEAKLEAFHSVYDVTKNSFAYFYHAETALLILLRNAIHHRDHLRLRSWNSEMHLNSGMKKKSGATFLFVNYEACAEAKISEYYFNVADIMDRIDDSRASDFLAEKMSKDERARQMKLIGNDLKIYEIIEFSNSEKYPLSQVYLNIIPIFICAMSKLFKHFYSMGVAPKGFDSEIYSEHFTAWPLVNLDHVKYKPLRIP